MDKNYVIHGTLNDYIDYARLIEQQAKDANKMKVAQSRPSTKKNKNVNTNRINSHTNRRKVLTKTSSTSNRTN